MVDMKYLVPCLIFERVYIYIGIVCKKRSEENWPV